MSSFHVEVDDDFMVDDFGNKLQLRSCQKEHIQKAEMCAREGTLLAL